MTRAHREIFAADFRDRIVHHLVINRVIKNFEEDMIPNSFSCRVGKGTLYAIKALQKDVLEYSKHTNKDIYVLKGDIKSFFMSLNKDKLFEVASKLIRETDNDSEFTKSLVNQIIKDNPTLKCIRKQPRKLWKTLLPRDKSLFTVSSDYGLPIGNLTSQIFANYYLMEFDKYIRDKLGFKYYGRYVDDFYVLSDDKEKLKELIKVIRLKLSELGLQLHPNKIYIQPVRKGVQFVGYVYKFNRIYTAKHTVGRFKECLQKINDYLADNIPDLDDLTYIIQSINSYFGFLKHCKTYNIRKKLIYSKVFDSITNYVHFNSSLSKIMFYREYSEHGKGISFLDLIKRPNYYKIDTHKLPRIVI